MKKRLLLVSRNFPPLTGGMERLNFHVFEELSKNFKVSLAGPEGCQAFISEKTSYKTFPATPLLLFLSRSIFTAVVLALRNRPQLILAGSGTSAISSTLAAKIVGAKTAVYLHGLDIIYPNPIYQSCFLPAIRRFDRILVNSSSTAKLAEAKGIKSDKIFVLNPGVTLPYSTTSVSDSIEFKNKLGIASKKQVLLSVGRLTERKGLPEFIKLCLKAVIADYPECILLIIGTEPHQAASKQSGTTDKIKQAIQQTGLENHVILLGQVSDQDLTEAYYASDLFIFPVLDLPGDVEGFGMVAIEAAAHGLPTVAFDVGGIIDAVAPGISGWLVKKNNYEDFRKIIMDYLKVNKTEKKLTKSNCINYAKKFSWDNFGSKLNNYLQPLFMNKR